MDKIRAVVKWISAHKVISILGILSVLAGAFFYHRMSVRNEGVYSEPLGSGSIVQSVYGIGTVTASHSFQLKTGVTSHINEIFVKEGDVVKKEQRLIHIDETLYRAPFAGTITYLPFKAGENVFAQLPSLILVDLLDRYLVVSLEQQGALRVQRGQNVKISFDTIRENSYVGVVESIYSYNNSFLARIDVSKLPPQILPGMTADVAIEIQKHDNVLIIPVAAIEKDHVWVKRKSSSFLQKVPIKLGLIDSAMAEVVSGDLQAGDRLLIRKNLEK